MGTKVETLYNLSQLVNVIVTQTFDHWYHHVKDAAGNNSVVGVLSPRDRHSLGFIFGSECTSLMKVMFRDSDGKITLPGNKIPSIGLGVYLTPANVVEDVVFQALETGYRHLDCARYYKNEHEVCNGIAKWLKANPAKNKREDVFYTTKIFDTDHGYELTKKAIADSLDKAAAIDYIDLVLIHSPQSNSEKRHGSWMALQEAVESGKVKNIGVSNYGIKHLEELLSYEDLKITPAVNQIELHPWLTRQELVKFCQSKNITVEAYSPLVRGKKFDDPTLLKLADKYDKSVAQILINWSLDKGFVALPKTTTISRLLPNLESSQFKLSSEDLAILDSLDENYTSGWDPTVYPLDNEK